MEGSFGGSCDAHNRPASANGGRELLDLAKVVRRPVSYDAAEHKQRNAVERFFNQRKNWRGLANRYIKHTLVYRGGAVPGAVQDSGCGELRDPS